MCEWTKGLLSQPTVPFGLPPAQVDESECSGQGTTCCRYIVSSGRRARVRRSGGARDRPRSPVVAMSKRLDSAFATASELVSPDDLDTVLARIVERAASAVRAPRYVLAVRPTQDAEMRVYGHGFPSPAAQGLAYAELAGEDALGESALRARSSRAGAITESSSPSNPRAWASSRRSSGCALYARHAQPCWT